MHRHHGSRLREIARLIRLPGALASPDAPDRRRAPHAAPTGGVPGVTYLWVALGSALGGVVRHWCSGVAARLWGETFPWGTIIVNVAGSFIIGLFATLTAPDGRVAASSEARLFVMVGLCGGYTTFSSFSLQSLALARAGEWAGLGMNIGLSVVLCLAAVWGGHAIAVAVHGEGGRFAGAARPQGSPLAWLPGPARAVFL